MSLSVLTPSNGAEHCAESCPFSEEGSSCDCVPWCLAQTPAGQCSHTQAHTHTAQLASPCCIWLTLDFSKSLAKSVTKTESEQPCGLSIIEDQSRYLC